MTAVILESTLTCPACGHVRTETMPTDACQWFYECERCRTVLKPKPGDCCVFCSFGTVPCPPVQERDASTSGCRSCDNGTTADIGEKIGSFRADPPSGKRSDGLLPMASSVSAGA